MTMKKFYALSFLLLPALLNAQVPNGGFESWTGANPDNWSTSNSQTSTHVTISSNAHGGTKAMKMDVWTVQSFTFGAIATCPEAGNFFSVSPNAAVLSGWYISNFAGGDKLQINGVLQAGGSTVGAGMLNITNSTSVYQQFSIPLNPTQTPDSAAITIAQLTASNGTTGLNPATTVTLDDITIGPSVGVEEETKIPAALEHVLPNPANAEAAIIYRLAEAAQVRLVICDLLGKEVKVLVDEKQSSGRFKAIAETSLLPAGMYFARLEAGNAVHTLKLNVTH